MQDVGLTGASDQEVLAWAAEAGRTYRRMAPSRGHALPATKEQLLAELAEEAPEEGS